MRRSVLGTGLEMEMAAAQQWGKQQGSDREHRIGAGINREPLTREVNTGETKRNR